MNNAPIIDGVMPTPVLPARRTVTVDGRFLVAAVVCLLALGVTAAVFVLTPGGQAFDAALLPLSERGASYEQDTPLLAPAKAVLGFFGDEVVLGVVLLAAVLLGGRVWTSVAAVGVVLGSVAATRALKEAFIRPDLDVPGSSTHNSFPSGHVAVATALVLVFLLVVPPAARWFVLVPGAALVVVVAAATMITGWHRLSDLVGGALVAGVLYCLAAAVDWAPTTARDDS